jgi:NMT1/THI5 like
VPERAAARELLLAEPVHHVGFLPIYVARHKGYFKDEGINIKLAVLAAGGFVNAVLSGDAFAYIASVDHNAFARAKGMSLIAVSNLLGRANIYMMARTDIPPMTGDLTSYLNGKRIAVGAYGGTPNNVLRYFLKKWNLDPRKDVSLIEVGNSSIVLSQFRRDPRERFFRGGDLSREQSSLSLRHIFSGEQHGKPAVCYCFKQHADRSQFDFDGGHGPCSCFPRSIRERD